MEANLGPHICASCTQQKH